MSMTWIAVAIDIGDDESIGHIAEACAVPIPIVVGSVVMVLGKLPKNASDGNLSSLSNTTIEDWAKWRGAPGVFAAALRQHMCDETGTLRAWDKLNGAAMRESKAAAQRMRDLRDRRRKEQEERDGGDSGDPPTAPRKRSPNKQQNRSRNVHRTFSTDNGQFTDLSGPGGPERSACATEPAPPDPVAQALLVEAESALFGVASASERAAIERLAATGDRTVILIELWEMATSPKHQVRGKARPDRISTIADVVRGAVELAGKGRSWDASYARGCVRRVVDRRPEPLSPAERATREEVRQYRASSSATVEETPEEVAARRRRTAESMRQWRANHGRPSHVGNVVESVVGGLVS